jgi:glutamate racemase
LEKRLQKVSKELPIGIFDSGVGGLTVMKEVMSHLPDEDILYLGDTARVPYGVRSPETVLRYSMEVAQFLVERGIKILVIACNTSSAVSVFELREKFSVPVIGVVEPGARAAVKATSTKKIAVTGTETTINSSSYERAIKSIDSSIEVTGVACPLFVPLIEEGWLEGKVVTLVAEKYLSSVKSDGADTLVLGCTHYPMIKKVIGDTVHVVLIDSAVETSKEVGKVLEKGNLLRSGNGKPVREFFVTDDPRKFSQVGEKFLGCEISNISKITL